VSKRQYPLRSGGYAATIDASGAFGGRSWLVWFAGSRIFVHATELKDLRRLLDKIEREDRAAFAKPASPHRP
jgi:hypothetical protein